MKLGREEGFIKGVSWKGGKRKTNLKEKACINQFVFVVALENEKSRRKRKL